MIVAIPNTPANKYRFTDRVSIIQFASGNVRQAANIENIIETSPPDTTTDDIFSSADQDSGKNLIILLLSSVHLTVLTVTLHRICPNGACGHWTGTRTSFTCYRDSLRVVETSSAASRCTFFDNSASFSAPLSSNASDAFGTAI